MNVMIRSVQVLRKAVYGDFWRAVTFFCAQRKTIKRSLRNRQHVSFFLKQTVNFIKLKEFKSWFIRKFEKKKVSMLKKNYVRCSGNVYVLANSLRNTRTIPWRNMSIFFIWGII